MESIIRDLIKALEEERQQIADVAMSKVLFPEEYARLVGKHQHATAVLETVRHNYHAWVEAQA